MKLFVTLTSPYARLARIVVIEKALDRRIEIVEAKTRTPGSPYYGINPSGRVPYLVTDDGIGMEDSQVICAYIDSFDGEPQFHPATPSWSHRRLEGSTRSMLDGIAEWAREMGRPEGERSPTTLAHERARMLRMADHFEREVRRQPELQNITSMAPWVLAVALETARLRKFGDLTEGRPGLTAWLAPMSGQLSMPATLPPQAKRS
jgi:glutathione S-transferase